MNRLGDWDYWATAGMLYTVLRSRFCDVLSPLCDVDVCVYVARYVKVIGQPFISLWFGFVLWCVRVLSVSCDVDSVGCICEWGVLTCDIIVVCLQALCIQLF